MPMTRAAALATLRLALERLSHGAPVSDRELMERAREALSTLEKEAR